jgi:uncharacterized protein (TIGR02001 family)
MKKIALILAALVAGASLSAQAPAPAPAPAAPSYSVTVDFPYASKYVFRGVQYAEDSFQPSAKLTVGSFYAGLWTNQPITSNIDNEIDLYAGYGFKLSDTWSLDVGATYYYYPEADASLGGFEHTFEPYAGVTGTFGSFTVGGYAYYDFDWESWTLQGTVGYSVPISDKATFSLLGTIGNVSPDAGDDYTYYGIGATVPYKLSDTATFTVGVQYATHDMDFVDDSHFWGTVGVTVVF